MTPAQAAWLRTLRDSAEPVPRPPKTRVGFNCFVYGWTTYAPRSNWREVITPKGLAALEAHEEKSK